MTNSNKSSERPPRAIPEPTLRRFPVYYQYLKKIQNEGKGDFISCTQIGNDLKLQPIQVRKDLEVTDAVGKPKLGYSVDELVENIEEFLGLNNTTDAYLIGVGNLGSALLGYNGFVDYGLNIIAAFDRDDTKIGTEIQGKMVFHIDKLASMVRRMNVQIGILTVPAHSAQELADKMAEAGIHAIWNFSPAKVHVPAGVIVQHENLASSLVVLSNKLAHALKAKANQ